jgi:hypothetical protein
MAGDKFIFNNNGVLTEKALNQSSAGVADAGKGVALDSTGKIDTSMMPVGVGAENDLIPCTENLAAGDIVNIYASSGAKCRKADATVSGKEANGFVLAAFTSGQTATVYRPSQSNTQRTGLTPGAKQYLSTTAGGLTETPPSTSGNVIQEVGVAISATVLDFNPKLPIVLA